MTDCVRPATGDGGHAPRRRLIAVLVLTATFMVVEVVGGWISGSLALIADAGHMLTDVAAIGLSLVAMQIGRRPADEFKTYGYRRWEILGALVNGAAIFAIAGWIVFEAIRRIGRPAPVQAGILLAVAAAGLLVNIAALTILHRSHQHSLNTRGAYLHVLSDLLGSVAALVAGAVIILTGWTPVDPILSILVAILLCVGAWRLVRESADVLLESVPSGVSMSEVQRRMLAVPGVTAVHDLHVWTVTSGMVAMSGHAVVPRLADHPSVLDGIRAGMAGLGIGHVTIQLEVGEVCEEALEG